MTLNIMARIGIAPVEPVAEFDYMGLDFFIYETKDGYSLTEKSSGHRIILLESPGVKEAKKILENWMIKNTVDKVKTVIDQAIKTIGRAN